MNPTDWLRLGVEQYLRDLPDDEFGDLIERTRVPESGPEDGPEGDAAFARTLFGGGRD